MQNLVRGVRDVARGAGFLLAHPRLLVWVIAPALITLLVVAATIWGIVALIDPAVAWATAHVPDFLAGWLEGLLRLLVIAGLAVAGYFVFVSIAGILAGPFCELLSEAVETEITGRPGPGFTLAAFARGLVAGIAHAIRRLFVSLLGLVLVLVLAAVIPVIGAIVALAVSAYLAAASAAYDCFDAVLARRLWPYRRKLAFLRAHRGRTLGLGGSVAGLLLVPGINLIALGLGATAATLAAVDLAVGDADPTSPSRSAAA